MTAIAPPNALARRPRPTKQQIRTSLAASSADGICSAIFENVVKGVLVSNFLLDLGAGAVEVGLLTSIPLLAHLLQPLGAYFAEKSTSRHRYCLLIFGLSRLVWLALVVGIYDFAQGRVAAATLVGWTIGLLAVCFILDALGGACWVSWMAVLVPKQLRGKYFGWRRSLASLAALVTLPLGGWAVSQWPGGAVQGFGVVLAVGILMGLVSLLCQFWMLDVDPQQESLAAAVPDQEKGGVGRDRNFLSLLVYLACWTFALNLSAPFLNFYLLDLMHISVQGVTLYSGIMAAANLVALVGWGRLADRVGNRPVLLLGGVLSALVPLLWLGAGTTPGALLVGLPLLYALRGGAIAAMELCSANIQLELAPAAQSSSYFAAAAAVVGVSGFLGTTVGSLFASSLVSCAGLFGVSTLLSLVSLAPLLAVKEPRSCSLAQLVPWAPLAVAPAKRPA